MKDRISKIALALLFVFFRQTAMACINCNKEIREAIFNSTFYPNLFVILSPFIVLGVVVAIISWISLKNHKAKVRAYPDNKVLSPVPLTAAAIVIGIGVGGFIDG